MIRFGVLICEFYNKLLFFLPYLDFRSSFVTMPKTTIKNWSKEAVIDLIEVYKNQPCLYNLRSEDYHNRERARDALAEMANVVSQYHPSVTEEDCKKKYQSLRNQFCKEYAKVLANKSGSGDIGVYTPKLWCYEQLVFLKESIYQKKGTFIGCVPEYLDEGYDYFPDDEEEEKMTVEYLEKGVEDFKSFLPETIVITPKVTMKRRKCGPASYHASLKKANLSESEVKCALPSPESSRGTTPETETLSSTLQMYLNKKVEGRTEKLSKNKYTAFGDFVGSWLNDNKNKESRKKCMCDILNIILKYEIDDSD